MKRRRWWTTRVGRAMLVFGATFLGLVGAGFVGMRHVSALAFARQQVPAPTRPDASWSLVYFAGRSHLDHAMLWNDIDSAIENARRADVIFVGNSQLQMALAPQALRKFERRTGLSAFSLCLPAETYDFPLALIEKFDLRPSVVVVNAPGFFQDRRSPVERQVRADSAWTTRRTVWEERLAAVFLPPASRFLPSFVAKHSTRRLLRSSTDGTWMQAGFPSQRTPVSREPSKIQWQTGAALRFRQALNMRGTQLMLTCVPSSMRGCGPASLLPIAASLGLPIVMPAMRDPIWTFDAIHFTALSGKRFSRALIRELERVPYIRMLVQLKRNKRALRSTPL